jgi:hypothetical protein
MYDPLTSTYSFPCPHGDAPRVPLSDFRTLERLPGASHPALFEITFSCPCGSEHPALVSHPELDVAPVGVGVDGEFRNFLTGHDDDLEAELLGLAATRIGAGEWPWSLFCFLEGRAQPMTPSALAVIAPGDRLLGVAARCPSCTSTSVNLVTREHLDIPFWNDRSVGVVEHVFEEDAVRTMEEFRSLLDSSRFDERRLELEW